MLYVVQIKQFSNVSGSKIASNKINNTVIYQQHITSNKSPIEKQIA